MNNNNIPTNPLKQSFKRARMFGDTDISSNRSLDTESTVSASSQDRVAVSGSTSVALVNSLLKKADEYYRLGRVYDWNRNLTGAMMQYSLAANTIVDVQEMVNAVEGEMRAALNKYLKEDQSSIKWCENLRCLLDNGLRHILGKVKQLQDTLRQVKGAAMWPVGQDATEDEEDDCKGIKPFQPDENSCKNLWFKTLIGMQEQKDTLIRSFIKPLEFPNMFADVAKGLLLYGPPGTGKTLLIKAAVNQLNSRPGIKVLFFTPTAADLKGKYFGESETKIKQLFKCAAKQACECQAKNKDKTVISIIFIDEVEAVGGNREDDSSGFMTTTVNALLQAMDGISSFKNVSVVAATNYPWKLDPAFLRRFTRKVYVPLPDVESISSLLQKNLSDLAFRTKARPNLDTGSVSCKVLKQEVDPCSDDYGCKEPSTDQLSLQSEWRKSEYANYFRYISPSEIVSFAEDLAKQKYSNSDVANLWGNVLSQIGEEGVRANVFVKQTTDGKRARFVSVASCSISEIKEAIEQKRTVFLDAPENGSITLGDVKFVHQYLKPLVTIHEPNVKAVYLLESNVQNETDDIPLLVHFNILVKESKKTVLWEGLDISNCDQSDYLIKQYSIRTFSDIYNLSNQRLRTLIDDPTLKTLSFGENKQVGIIDYINSSCIEGATRNEDVFALCFASRAGFFKRLKEVVSTLRSSRGTASQPLGFPKSPSKSLTKSSSGNNNETQIKEIVRVDVKERIFDNLAVAFCDVGDGTVSSFAVRDNSKEAQKYGDSMATILKERQDPTINIKNALNKGMVETSNIIQITDNHIRSVFGPWNVQVQCKKEPYNHWKSMEQVKDKIAQLVGVMEVERNWFKDSIKEDSIEFAFKKELDASIQNVSVAEILEETEFTELAVPSTISMVLDNPMENKRIWNEIRKAYLPFTDVYRNVVRKTAMNVTLSIDHLFKAKTEITSTADSTSIANLDQYAKNADDFMRNYKAKKN